MSLLEQVGRALFRSFFIKYEQDPERQDSELGPIPVGWEVLPLSECLSVIETGGRPRGGIAGISSGVPSIGAEHVIGLGKYDRRKTKYVPQAFFDGMRRGVVQDGDVLLYKDGGRPGQFEPHVTLVGEGFPFAEMCINEHVYRLRANERLTQA